MSVYNTWSVGLYEYQVHISQNFVPYFPKSRRIFHFLREVRILYSTVVVVASPRYLHVYTSTYPVKLICWIVRVVVVVFTLTDRASTIPVIYVVANPVRGHKEVPRSTGHIMVTTRYSDQQGSKSRQKVVRLYKRWHRPITKRFIKPPLLHIESSLDRIGLLSPTHDQRSQQQIGQTFQSVLINDFKFLKATHRTKIRKIEIPRSIVVEALSW